jgi:hypothetical protein
MKYTKKVRLSPEESTKAKNSGMNIGKIRNKNMHVHYRRPANLNKSVSKMPLMAFFVTSWQLAFSYSL